MRPLDVDAYYDRLEREWHEAQDEGRGEPCPVCEREACADPADCEAARVCARCGDDPREGPVGSALCWTCVHESKGG